MRLRLLQLLASFYPFVKGQGRIAQYEWVKAALRQLPAEVTARSKSGTEIVVCPHEYLGRMLYLFGQHESRNLRTLETLLADKNVLWDVGSNYGYFSLELAKTYPSKTILAIEPQPKLAEMIQKSSNLNGIDNISVIPFAVADCMQRLKIFVPRDNFATASVIEKASCVQETVVVECTTLDAIAEDYAIPDLIKIDIEGAELRALTGAHKILATNSPAILMEVNDARSRPLGDNKAVQFLLDYDYSFYPANERLLNKCNLKLPLTSCHDVVGIRDS